MTTTDYINHVDDSITKALRHESHIDAGILDIKGFSTGVQRRLVNNLCRLPKPEPKYLEVGLYAGATFCAAMNNNPVLEAVGIEDFSQPFGSHTIRAELNLNASRFFNLGTEAAAHLVDHDCWTVPANQLPEAVDIFYFDGEHSFESQARALPHFLDALADTFIFMVDDTNWEPVKTGTAQGFEALKDRVKIEKHWHLSDPQQQDGPNWHNGVDIYVCTKINATV